jgi:Uma2 family endonuclease
MVQAYSPVTSSSAIAEQRFILPGRRSWVQFKALEQVLTVDYAGVRLFYLDGVVELMSISATHELIKSILDALLVMFFCQQQIDAVPMGSATLQAEDRAVSAEPDLSYRLDGEMGVPQLAIEVALSSGGIEKLGRYRRLEITEVWFWQDDAPEEPLCERLWLYGWDGEDYVELSESRLLVGLRLDLLESGVRSGKLLKAVKIFGTE